MARQLFVNLPVDDLTRSKEFFTELGFTFNPQFSDENAACMVVNDESFVMLLANQFLETFTDKEIADSTETMEVLIALSADSREEIDSWSTSSATKPTKTTGTSPAASTSQLTGSVTTASWCASVSSSRSSAPIASTTSFSTS